MEKANPLEKIEMEKVEEATKALERLLEALAKLKETGTLDMLVALAEMSEEILELGLNDRRLHHAMAAGEGALNSLEDVDPINLKANIEVLSGCTMKALENPELLKNIKPMGLFSLLSVAKDPDVGTGLAVMIALAKMVGKCIREQTKNL
ncbi:hypothetical protein IPA_00345 [Ignicoccus pacificus DSM 13166]|uniref:DUF1641 domain-containing protein n=1 Tax=Ignicoccus pacificus DSM 13166 TaxID=940294 RepID=A0A977KAB5_9CREN|nr:hypothetical protein IPA_00345 [Ignicoccus pacificus DSM 13166]